MTYKPRLHHFTRLFMSVAVGLSFTGCGNSSNGGSTGSSFEQVPLIGIDGAVAAFEGVDFSAGFEIETTLYNNGTLTFVIGTGEVAESFKGSWRATQTDNNIYQITLSEITSKDGHNCTMTCKAFILTIPEDQLKIYREGNVPVSATLYVDFTHNKGGASCPLNEVEIESTMTGGIKQFIPG